MADNINNCAACERTLRRRRPYVLNERLLETRRDFVEQLLRIVGGEITFDGTRSICHSCRHRIDAAINQERQVPAAPVLPAAVVNVQGVRRAPNTARRCLIDNCNNSSLLQVPNSVKVQLLSYYHFYVPNLARICQRHLLHMAIEEIPGNITNQMTDLNAESVGDIINMYTQALEQRSQFNVDDVSDDELSFWTGRNRATFNDLLSQIPSLNRSSSTPRNDLAIYLCKIRSGEPNNRIASLFNITERTIGRKIHKVRQCLITDFVPLHLGLDHITRDEVIARNRVLPNVLFGNEESPKAIVTFDGTYIYIEKSSNFLFQRRSYSLHKFRNLIKPFMIVCADGYILDVTGPYSARTTDADIMKMILQNHDGPIEDGPFHFFFHEGDSFILDRGFRDSIPLIETYGYVAHMPPTKQPQDTQLSTEQANKSRLITMVRWVVETINGRFKRDFKIFKNRVFNKHVPHIFEDFKIAAALINYFQEPYGDSPYTEDFIEIINQNIQRPNRLFEYVEENNLNRQRVSFHRMTGNDPDIEHFPQLTIEELIKFSIGTYHVKLARSYCSEHLKAAGVYNMELYRHPTAIEGRNNNTLIRCRIHSRHVTTKIYYTYIMFDENVNGRNAITEYYCTCYHGKRTLGSCAHVISVVYYLGWARHRDHFDHPAMGMDYVLRDIEIQ
ncbi:uncharacterized protein LOC123868072 isoform X1 [Maniola jurtina]|uniref:uncharacterized protein LOC123868072 isoform X1 n=1 Tax=Maniola jurtina TaxID=191418 RepID=UPI001E688A19|nr:uncharacterized protein LOC123868072 isoform X1 [Maniola jurtina]